MRCLKCAAENREGRRFCAECGTALKLACSSCGALNEPGEKFCGDCGSVLAQPADARQAAAAASPHAKHGQPQVRSEGERRQLTVMFCDVVDSTALSERLDPEDLLDLMRSYQSVCVGAISSFDGYVAKYLGDGVLAYFGYPAAHEDDAARAARAGLAIVEKLRCAQLRDSIHVRVGIHTGLVVAGEMGSGEYPEHRAIVGETPNFAARLQEQAAPDSVVISPATYNLVAGLFECEEIGQRMLKGISSPSLLYRVVRESQAHSRFEVAVRSGLTPLVGREHELGLLRERWQDARQGNGQVVLVSGEPGIGKSRLVQMLGQEALTEGAKRLEFRCSPYHQNSAFYPIIDHLQRFLEFEREELAESKLDKLARMLSTYRFTEPDTLALMASLLSLPVPANVASLALSPQKEREKTRAALVAWTIAEAEKAPVYYVWEDLHWADPSSLEGLSILLDQVPAIRLFAVWSFRPDFRPPWPPRSHIVHLMLARLGQREVETMAERITGGKPLPVEVMQEVAKKTDGIPLFVEELTRTVMESGVVQERDGHYELTSPLEPLAIPSSLNDSLMARLDRLGAVKEVAQLAATVGREFSYELLEAVALSDATALQEALAKLVESEILHQRGLLPQARYIFRHALIQDAAYQSLLRSTRQRYHGNIAHTLAERFPEIKATQPELLARHYTEAGLIAQAIPYWLRAGQQAGRRSAHVEAVNHLTKGLDLLATLPDGPERAQQELALQVTMGASLAAIKGFAAPELGKVYTRARELCRRVGETPQLFPALSGLRLFYSANGEIETSRELGEQMLRLARNADDPTLMLQAHYALAIPLHLLGEFAPALDHCEKSISFYDSQRHRSLAFIYGMDAGVTSLSLAAWMLCKLGYPDQALEKGREAVALAREVAHPLSTANALMLGFCLVHWLRGEMQFVLESADALIALSQEQGFAFWLAEGISMRGTALVALGNEEEGLAEIHRGIAGWRATGARSYRTTFLAMLLEAHLKRRDTEEGIKVLNEALATAESTKERHEVALLYRQKGELMRIRGNDGDAERSFGSAIRIAKSQSAKSLELRATTSLARMLVKQGRRADARAMLAEIYAWFTEGFNTTDLRDAKALLDELSD
jgi:class 3 adenylate cyclase/tetratricopeptide (TPR) repeat protein